VRNTIPYLLSEHPEIARVVRPPISIKHRLNVRFGLVRAALHGFFEYLTPMSQSVNGCRKIRLPTEQFLDAFENVFRFTLGTNSLEPRLPGFVA